LPDTINWREWSERAFTAASAENKPILLSLVTAWSEECSLMDRTTYARREVVAIVDSRFVPIRVDADRRPDINERYDLGGWPTTAALTPDGQLLSGGTYFGPDAMVALLTQAADSWRDRGDEIRRRAAAIRDIGGARLEADPRARPKADTTAAAFLRSLLIDQFDPEYGGFGTGSKHPNVPALTFALMLGDETPDEALKTVAAVTLDRIGALWDPAHGGFYRYADRRDWSQPGTEKTLEDNAALLNLYLDAGVLLQSAEFRSRAAELAGWIGNALADQTDGGFHNSLAAVSRVVDPSMYVDRNADMVAAFLRAAAVFQDPWLRDFALKSLETVIVPGYKPGGGVAHVAGVRGLLGDQVRAASALIWAHVATEQLPYSMLALELTQFAVRTMWDEHAGCFRDRATLEDGSEPGLLAEPIRPFALNCQAACVLDRIATMTGDETHHRRALAILGVLAPEYRRHGLFGAPYALAVHEVIDRRPPPGLNLSRVEWNLEHD
jgi:uncharacterized protein YyaL (SSP411 family)